MFPYERVVAFLAGPLAALIGIVATAVVHQTVSKAVALNVATFALSSAATFLAHHKWLDNISAWWVHQEITQSVAPATDTFESSTTPDLPTDPA